VAVRQKFCDAFANILDWIATYRQPIYIVGDFDICLDRPDDPHTEQLRLLVDCYRLVLHVTGPTHQRGGTLDAVITHDTDGRPQCLTAEDFGLSNHFLLRWEVSVTQPTPYSVYVRRRPWRRLDVELFRFVLSA
jgi:hypothetical protein